MSRITYDMGLALSETAELGLMLRDATSGETPDFEAVLDILDRLEAPSPDDMVKRLVRQNAQRFKVAAPRPSSLWRDSFDVQTLAYMDHLYEELS